MRKCFIFIIIGIVCAYGLNLGPFSFIFTAHAKPKPPSKHQKVYAKHELTVYAAPAFDAARLGRFAQNTAFELVAVENRFWYKVRTPDAKTGFLSAFWVTVDTQTKTPTTQTRVEKTEEKSSISTGEILEAPVSDNNSDKNSETTLKTAALPPKVYAKHKVTVFAAPAFDARRIGRFKIGTDFKVLAVQDGFWYKVRTPKKTSGYISRFWVTSDPKTLSQAKAQRKANTAQKKAKIAALEAQAKLIPANNIDKNLQFYRKLLELDPKNRFYKDKVSAYRKRYERHQKALRGNKRLELIDWHWQQEGNLVTVQGRVKNISKFQLTFAAVMVIWHDRKGRAIASAKTFLDDDPFYPDNESSFKLSTPHFPAMYDATISFITVNKPLSTYFPNKQSLKLAGPAARP
jgi:uncharacterized protein YgiM (DUF1202 family)